MLKRGLAIFTALLLVSCSGDGEKGIGRSSFELKESSFAELDGWENDDFSLLKPAIKSVCSALNRRSELKSEVMAYSLREYKQHCARMAEISGNQALKAYIKQNFVPYLVHFNGSPEGKFTSYYEAAINASYTRGGKYQYPVYGKPADLVEVNLRDFDSSLPNRRLVGRVKNGKLVKYYTRAEIENGEPDAPVILWGDNPVDIYIMQIQGAAVATLPDGKEVRVGYADNNGHQFKGIGSILLERGLIKPSEASMPQIREWLRKNGETAKKNMQLNDRFIFHKIVNAEGPIGAMGLPLFAGRSLAVDRSYIPLGTLLWLETKNPDGGKLNRLVIAEDVGSAIKGGVRGDYFWGHGEEALKDAGRMNAKGRYFVLLPKGTEPKIYGR